MAEEQRKKTDGYVCEEIIELDDLLAQLENHYGSIGDDRMMSIAAMLLLVKQIRFLRDDLANR